jgi:hypothetical protein
VFHLAALGRADRVTPDPRLALAWAEVSEALARAGWSPDTCVFRSTEGDNAAIVAAWGTDRHGRSDPGFAAAWRSAGLRGPPRPFERALYGSTAGEIATQLAQGIGETALTKCPTTEAPVMLVYRRRALARIGPRLYVFRAGDALAPRRALRLMVPLAAFVSP